MHFNLNNAVALAGFAASALLVEGKATRVKAPDFGFLQIGKQVADVGENAGVCRRVGTRRSSYRRLADFYDLIEIFHSFDGVMPAPYNLCPVEFTGKTLVDNLIDKRTFPGTGNTCDAGECAERNRNVYVLQIVLCGSPDGQPIAVTGSALFGHGYFPRAA